jgi:hypothetical protein
MSANTAQSFRAQMSNFRWASGVNDDSQAAPAAAPPPADSAFSRAWGSVSGYIPLRNQGASAEEEAYFALSVGYMISARDLPANSYSDGNGEHDEDGRRETRLNTRSYSASLASLSAALVEWHASVSPSCSFRSVRLRYTPTANATVAIKPRKFALAFTLGSCLFMLGFAILHGPWNRELQYCCNQADPQTSSTLSPRSACRSLSRTLAPSRSPCSSPSVSAPR